MSRPKLPARNPRHTIPRVCAFCESFVIDNGSWNCTRPEDPTATRRQIDGDVGDGFQYLTTCDRFKRPDYEYFRPRIDSRQMALPIPIAVAVADGAAHVDAHVDAQDVGEG